MPYTPPNFTDLKYLSGMGNLFTSEAEPNAVPKDQNLPQDHPLGLYPEQVNLTTFTYPRATARMLWLYRIRPSNMFMEWKKISNGDIHTDFSKEKGSCASPSSLMWKPLAVPTESTDFVQGMHTLLGIGDPASSFGYAIHLYACNSDMQNKAFQNSDGSLLIVPGEGTLHIQTELGLLTVSPREVVVIPQGVRFSVFLPDKKATGHVLEIFHEHFVLPELGVIGRNGLANPRHFQAPTAYYEDVDDTQYTIVMKHDSQLHQLEQPHSPFDVVGWYGDSPPFKYDLSLFNAMGTITFDHPDPSLLSVLTVPTSKQGLALVDFAVFCPRWFVAEHSFRPVYPHRNAATEVNSVISGGSKNFPNGSTWLSPYLSPHGVTEETFQNGFSAKLEPEKAPDDSYWFMFESGFMARVTPWASNLDLMDQTYPKRFQTIKKRFHLPQNSDKNKN